MELICGMPKIIIDYSTGGVILQIPVFPESRANAESLINENYDKTKIKVEKYRKVRSKDANSYFWVLLGKLSEKMGIDSVELYRQEIKKIGVYKDFENLEEGHAATLIHAWKKLGLGWIAEKVDYNQSGELVTVRCWYGSSQYNSKQMSRLIDNVIQDCHAVGITDTKTPEEIADLISLWGCAENG